MTPLKVITPILLLGSLITAGNAQAAQCTISRSLDSEGTAPISWNNNDTTTDYKASPYVDSCSNVPAGSTIDYIDVSFEYRAKTKEENNDKEPPLSSGLLPGDYSLSVHASGIQSSVQFSLNRQFSWTEGRTIRTDAFNGMQLKDMSFAASARVYATSLTCRQTFLGECDQFMKAHYGFTIFYSPPPAVPSPPATVTATLIGSDDINISWSSVSGADYYLREVRIDGGVWQNQKTYTDTNVVFYNQLSRTYEYRVSACSYSEGCSGWTNSNSVSVTVAPNQPGWVNAQVINGNSVVISWDSVRNTTRYEREVSVNGGTWQNRKTYTTTSVTFTNQQSRNYQYRVRACNNFGCSLWQNSNTVSVTVPPDAPSWVSAQVINGNSVVISWAGVQNATHYNREVSVNGGAWQNQKTYTGTSVTFTNQQPRNYRYQVRACNEYDCSSWVVSNSVTVN